MSDCEDAVIILAAIALEFSIKTARSRNRLVSSLNYASYPKNQRSFLVYRYPDRKIYLPTSTYAY